MATSSNDRIGSPTSAASADGRAKERRKFRVYASISLLFVIILFLSSGTGIALSVIVIVFKPPSPGGNLSLPSRTLLFAASCMSLLYVLFHVLAARKPYHKGHGPPQSYGQYVVALALLLARLGIPIWIASVVLAAIIAAGLGLNVARGLVGNIPWLNLLVSVSALLSSAALIAVIETSSRPFAILGISKMSFIDGRRSSSSSTASEDAGQQHLSRQASIEKSREERLSRRSTLTSKSLFRSDQQDTSLSTPDLFRTVSMSVTQIEDVAANGTRGSAATGVYNRDRRRVRSQTMPTALDAISSTPPRGVYFAWRSPMPDLGAFRSTGITSFDQISRQRATLNDDEMSLLAQASASTADDSCPSPGLVAGIALDVEPTLPTIPPSPLKPSLMRRDSVMVKASVLETRRWTSTGMESPSVDGAFVAVPLPAMAPRAMDEKTRPISRSVSVRGPVAAGPGVPVTNFSRPRTAAAAAMQAKVERRLQAAKGREQARADALAAQDQRPAIAPAPETNNTNDIARQWQGGHARAASTPMRKPAQEARLQGARSVRFSTVPSMGHGIGAGVREQRNRVRRSYYGPQINF
ncbi:hypothetical protein QBC46DRAFT_356413 [Diplogelasinospora grovesii]|uniref:Uncharacterized protein n=1 Tax=Diplogelasinospora grovesii TaxID=303347 RepID=A0AAN6N230_9PEZI|nr:hypothetical protein QBC46DRAFT_356413 [Diplogelasinospora grovesii]